MISLIIFLILNFFIVNYNQIAKNTTFKVGFEVENQVKQEQTEEKETKEVSNEEANNEWYLEIPCINLKATIAEGTNKENMDKFIGHFEETKKDIGNIGLAGHNRGYENNYFENLKELKKGDKIYYHYYGEVKEYIVEIIAIIKDTDWTYLEDTEDNRITLITCVENEPEYRRCVQGKEIKKESEENKFE